MIPPPRRWRTFQTLSPRPFPGSGTDERTQVMAVISPGTGAGRCMPRRGRPPQPPGRVGALDGGRLLVVLEDPPLGPNLEQPVVNPAFAEVGNCEVGFSRLRTAQPGSGSGLSSPPPRPRRR